MKKRNLYLGACLIFFGIAFLVMNYVFDIQVFNFGPGDFWPLIVLFLGVIFEFAYFSNGRNPGLLVPGGILCVNGILFLFEVSTDWRWAEYTWPVYIFAVAAGLFQLYLFNGRPKGLLIASSILAGIAGMASAIIMLDIMANFADTNLVLPIILIVIGILIFTGNWRKRSF